MGGAKVSTKITIIENLLDKVDNLILGGGMTFTFVKANGGNIGTSLCEDDYLEIDEELYLNGEGSSGIAKTTVFATDRSRAKIINKAYGNAPFSRGHIECNEIIKGDSVEVGTVPELYVTNEKAELTHEASIGRVNVKQMETLMSKGLSEEEATDMIVRGMLR